MPRPEISGPTPSVSAIVTTKNSARTIASCLQSIRAQHTESVELIVVDNGSTDGTAKIACEMADVVLNAGPERSAQRNAGIRVATAPYVLILDSDMALAPDVVTACLKAIKDHPAVVIPEESFGTGFWSRCKAFERSFYLDDAEVCAARFFRRDDLLKINGYDETLTGMEDWDLSIRVCSDRKPTFAEARIYHDEGRHTLSELYLKKRYYGFGAKRFTDKHGAAARARLTPFRSSLLRATPKLLRHPVLGIGLVLMKAVELSGVLMGMARSEPPPGATLYADKSKN